MQGSSSFAALNEDQAGAAQFGVDRGPLLIIAGAGSGKTQTLAHRVAHLIEEGAIRAASCSSPFPGAPRRKWNAGSSASSAAEA